MNPYRDPCPIAGTSPMRRSLIGRPTNDCASRSSSTSPRARVTGASAASSFSMRGCKGRFPTRSCTSSYGGPDSTARETSAGRSGSKKARRKYHVRAVFDRSQVEPLEGREPALLEPTCRPLTGDSHAEHLDPARDSARSLRYSVEFRSTPAAIGCSCDARARRIVVDADAGLHHHLHRLHGTRPRDRRRDHPVRRRGGEHGALDAVNEFAGTIDRLARRIEDALVPRSSR
jgi:hypothetical protein